MILLLPSRAVRGFAWLACCCASAVCCAIGQAQGGVQSAEGAAAKTLGAADSAGGRADHAMRSGVGKHQVRVADEAYLEGAKKLGHEDLDGAEHEFQRALQLNPDNGTYAVALSMTHERQVNELVHHASTARLAGDDKTAETLLAEARSIDPQSTMVIEHSGPFVRQAEGGAGGQATLADRSGMVADAPAATSDWKIQQTAPAGAVRLAPAGSVKSFDLRGDASDVLRSVAQAYGIRVLIDDSLERKTMRFNLQNATYEQAMGIAMTMAQAFAVPVDERSVIVAMDSADNRQRLERQVEETIYLPGLAVEQINDLAQVVRTIFEVKQASVEPALGKILLRAPQYMLDPLNQTLKDLIDSGGEVMVEVKLYEVASTHSLNAGATIPNQLTFFNVNQAANEIVNQNQALVQQAIAQGYITSSTSNLDIALALIQLGLVQSPLATNLIGVFGGGLTRTGVSGTTATTLNLGLNSSDTRTLDDVQLRVGDRQDAVFREGVKYPITQSTYSTGGISNLPPGIGNQTINGVPVANLLSQFTGGASATIPIVTYEDLGVTLKAKPVIEKSGRINLLLDLKIEALSGSSLSGNPILDSRQFATDLTVADGESALMVSDVNKNEADAITGLPGLGGLPGFELPLDDTRDRDKRQLVVVVTPHIVRRRSNMIAGPRIPLHGGPAED